MSNRKPRIIAFYLPQYHPTPDNDRWWGKGFTEWTNVGKAKPLFKGHYQPRIPADLGYYDLRLPQVREAQAVMAREAGVEGFCYYHYWFGSGRRELELPFEEVLRTGEPSLPFCLCWANESWHSKFWNKDGTIIKRPLIEQEYGDEEDILAHFNAVLPALRDERYIKVDGKPLFMIYRPADYKNVECFIARWQTLARENGLEGVYFVAHINKHLNPSTIDALRDKGFDAVTTVGLWEARKRTSVARLGHALRKVANFIFGVPNAYRYKDVYHKFLSEIDSRDDVFPSLVPNWDHTPRSGKAGYLLTDSTPELFGRHAAELLSVVAAKPENRRIAFLKSWNEWGEGNYMEPDLRYGKGYIEALRQQMDKF